MNDAIDTINVQNFRIFLSTMTYICLLTISRIEQS